MNAKPGILPDVSGRYVELPERREGDELLEAIERKREAIAPPSSGQAQREREEEAFQGVCSWEGLRETEGTAEAQTQVGLTLGCRWHRYDGSIEVW